jgi:hypothetical protein
LAKAEVALGLILISAAAAIARYGVELRHPQTGRVVREVAPYMSDTFGQPAFSSDSQWVAAPQETRVRVWRVSDGHASHNLTLGENKMRAVFQSGWPPNRDHRGPS